MKTSWAAAKDATVAGSSGAAATDSPAGTKAAARAHAKAVLEPHDYEHFHGFEGEDVPTFTARTKTRLEALDADLVALHGGNSGSTVAWVRARRSGSRCHSRETEAHGHH